MEKELAQSDLPSRRKVPSTIQKYHLLRIWQIKIQMQTSWVGLSTKYLISLNHPLLNISTCSVFHALSICVFVFYVFDLKHANVASAILETPAFKKYDTCWFQHFVFAYFYRTQVTPESGLWVMLSTTHWLTRTPSWNFADGDTN